jgi:dethiobiotin synthetase
VSEPATRGLFVTGTDTGVGKTVVAGAVIAALVRRGASVAAFKPVVTGLEEPAPFGWPHDHALLAGAAGTDPKRVSPARFGPAVSPHLAAAQAGATIDVDGLLAAARAEVEGADVLVVEGVGGLLVPLTDTRTVRDFAVALGLPVVVAARTGLGTINHTLLTLEAARAAGLEVRGVALTPWPDAPSALERSNRETIERLGGVAVATVPPIASGLPGDLAAAGAELPLREWLA